MKKRIKAEAWFKSLSSRYSAFAYDLKQRGFTYCQIMDYFAGRDSNESPSFR